MRTSRGAVAVAACVVAGGLLTATATATAATADDAGPTVVWQRPAGQTLDPDIRGYRRVGADLLFTVDTERDGRRVIATDGTRAGTRPSDAVVDWVAGNTFARFGDLNVFVPSDDDRGREPWVSDGTQAGTFLLRDINPGPASSSLSDPVLFQGRLYFSATDDVNGRSIWATDGTREGTVLVVDPVPGPDGGAKPIAAGDRTLFLSASGAEVDGVPTGPELWASDGTAEGSRFVADLRPGPDPSNLSRDESLVVDVGGTDRLYAAATDAEHGNELWTSDGTAAGTRRVADLAPGTRSSSPEELYGWRGQVLFFAESDRTGDRSLWRTDGTTAGTVRLSGLHDVVTGDDPDGFYQYGSGRDERLLLTAADGTGARTLWQTDGTPTGSRQVRLPVPAGSRVGVLSTWRSQLVLGVGSGPHGSSPWITDLTDAGTYRLAQEPTPGSWDLVTVLGDRVLWVNKDVDLDDQLVSLDLPSATTRPTTTRAEVRQAVYGRATVRVRVTGPTGTTPTGTVTLRGPSGVVGTGRLAAGLADVPLSTSLRPGAHTLAASYAGTTGLAASMSTVRVQVAQAPARVTTTVRSRLRPDRRHRLRVTLAAPGTPTAGTFTVRSGSRVLARGTARSTSRTTVRLPRLRPGRHRLVVTWSGSSTTTQARSVRVVRVVRR